MNINNKLIKRQRLPKGQSTIQRKWQGTQDEGAIKDGQSRENGRVHKTKGQSKMDNPEKMAA